MTPGDSCSAGRTLGWGILLLIVIGAGLLRTSGLDLPPGGTIEFTDLLLHPPINDLDAATNILAPTQEPLTAPLFRLQLATTLGRMTASVGALVGLESWTWNRIWVWCFSLVTILLLAGITFLSARRAGHTPHASGRLALIVASLLVVSPLHRQLIHAGQSDGTALVLQLLTLIVTLKIPDLTGRAAKLASFVVAILALLAMFASPASLIWFPAIILLLAGTPNKATNIRRIGTVLGIALVIAIIGVWVARWSLFNPSESYARLDPDRALQMSEWYGHPQWMRTHAARLVHMISLPGVIAAVMGLLCAPAWLRLTAVLFAIVSCPFANRPLVDYHHGLVPLLALVGWGIHALMTLAGIGRDDRIVSPKAIEPKSAQRHLGSALALVAALLFTVLLIIVNPIHQPLAVPAARLLNAAGIIAEHVPDDQPVDHDDTTGVFDRLLRHRFPNRPPAPDDAPAPFQFCFNRDSRLARTLAPRRWVHWASLPGDFNGMLLGPFPSAYQVPEGSRNLLAPEPDSASMLLDLQSIDLPTSYPLTGDGLLSVPQGSRLELGFHWRNPMSATLAGMVWRHDGIGDPLPPPVREGGFAVGRQAVLSLPPGIDSAARYTFEISEDFPCGDYTLVFYPFTRYEFGIGVDPSFVRAVPLRIRITPSADRPAALPISRDYRELYPFDYTGEPDAWTERWWYRDCEPLGYREEGPVRHVLSAPGSPPGQYRLSVTGASSLLTNPDTEGYDWADLVIRLEDGGEPLAIVKLHGREPRISSIQFNSRVPFDYLVLDVQPHSPTQGTFPLWYPEFSPRHQGEYMIQHTTLLGVTLEAVPAATSQ